ncbi:hypothetical protein [Rhodococcus pseudokoreensis]|uniref:hypothetical protein n=1 Tax=Rhodococcus pseudokoreensis TaxID=2811421 RepID=UPI001F126AEE|nr:hypothetical protein [Rhodococcus pseudokoreensis]
MRPTALRQALLISAVVPAALLLPALASAAEPTAEGSQSAFEREIDKIGWHDGFEITVDKVTAKPDDATTTLDFDLNYKNLVGVSHTPTDKAYLEVDGAVVKLSFDSPEIAGGGQASGTATASLKTSSDAPDVDDVVDSVVLVYGQADQNQTRIPLAEHDSVESIEPRGIPAGMTFGTDMEITLDEAFLWPSYQTGEKDKHEVWVKIHAHCGRCSTGGFSDVNPGDFELTGPDGQSSRGDKRGGFISENVSSINKIEGEWIVFVMDEPTPGAYTFLWENSNPAKPAQASTQITL